MPGDFNFVWDVIDVWAEDRGRLAACWPIGREGEGRATFWDLRDRSHRLAGLLSSKGITAGDAVAIAAPEGIDLAVALLAVLRIGAVAVLLDPATRVAASRAAIERASAVATIATPEGARRLGKPSSPVRIVLGERVAGWTGSTGGKAPARVARPDRSSAEPAVAWVVGPKAELVRHSHGWVYAQRFVGEFWLDLRRTDLVASTLETATPLGTSVALFAPWMTGCPVAWSDAAGRLSIADRLARHPVSILASRRETYAELVRARVVDLPHLRHCVSSGTVAPKVARAWHAANGHVIHAGWGRAECPLIAAHLRGLAVRAGSIGRSFPGHDVAVVDDAGRDLAAGIAGEVALRGRPPTLAVGFASTDVHRMGVRARRDEQGYLWLL